MKYLYSSFVLWLIEIQHGVPRIAATAVRTEQQRQDEIVKIEKYQALVDLIETKVYCICPVYMLSADSSRYKNTSTH